MLILEIKGRELFDEERDVFIQVKPMTLKLEHSLISISKWESKWEKPFLTKETKTKEQILDYVSCMLITPVHKDFSLCLTNDDINKVIDYIDLPMTATTVTFLEKTKQKAKEEVITSELIYYWMLSAGIPFECEKWHLNRLFALLKICGAKNAPKKKMNADMARSRASLNAKRRAMMKSRG